MSVLQVVLQILLGVTSLLLTLMILLHKGRGGGLSDMFGGGVTSSLGASGVAERNLNRITVLLGVIWITCIVVLGVVAKYATTGSRIRYRYLSLRSARRKDPGGIAEAADLRIGAVPAEERIPDRTFLRHPLVRFNTRADESVDQPAHLGLGRLIDKAQMRPVRGGYPFVFALRPNHPMRTALNAKVALLAANARLHRCLIP